MTLLGQVLGTHSILHSSISIGIVKDFRQLRILNGDRQAWEPMTLEDTRQYKCFALFTSAADDRCVDYFPLRPPALRTSLGTKLLIFNICNLPFVVVRFTPVILLMNQPGIVAGSSPGFLPPLHNPFKCLVQVPNYPLQLRQHLMGTPAAEALHRRCPGKNRHIATCRSSWCAGQERSAKDIGQWQRSSHSIRKV